MKLIVALVLSLVLSTTASAGASPKDVEAAVARGDYARAETLLREAVAEHPNSAKAHYVLAEVLAHEGDIRKARAEAVEAARIDPASSFTDPATFHRFVQKLDAALITVAVKAPVASSTTLLANSTFSAMTDQSRVFIVLILLAAMAGFLYWVMMSHRSYGTRAAGPNSRPEPGHAPQVQQPPIPSQPVAAAPGQSGAGTAVAAGFGGLAAGVLLADALSTGHRGTRERAADAVEAPSDVCREPSAGAAYNDLRSEPIDFGTNDSSWSDSSTSFDSSGW